MNSKVGRVLIHLSRDRRVPVDPAKVFEVEAAGGETRIKMRKGGPLVDIRPLGDIAPLFQAYGFVRVHRSHMVNLRRIHEIRMRASGGWEVVLKPPMKTTVPVSRGMVRELWRSFGEE